MLFSDLIKTSFIIVAICCVALRFLPALIVTLIMMLQKLLPHHDRDQNLLRPTKCWWKAVFLPMYELDGISLGKYDGPQTFWEFLVGSVLTIGIAMLFILSSIPSTVIAAIVETCWCLKDDIENFHHWINKKLKYFAK